MNSTSGKERKSPFCWPKDPESVLAEGKGKISSESYAEAANSGREKKKATKTSELWKMCFLKHLMRSSVGEAQKNPRER